MNKAISEQVLKLWYDNCKHYLDCEQENRIMVEKDFKQKPIEMPFLLPHEFLFLLCNNEDRLSIIKQMHNPELVSVKGNINNWELINKEGGGYKVSHIHLLSQTAFVN